jgi:predicted Zn-dependent protease
VLRPAPILLVCALALCTGCASLRAPSFVAAPPTKPLNKTEAKAAMQRIDNARDEAQCAQAITLWQEGRTVEGRNLLDQVLARNPGQPLARRLTADLALERGDVQQAEKTLIELLREYPDDQAVRASLAWLYESQGRDAEAEELFQQLDDGFSPAA